MRANRGRSFILLFKKLSTEYDITINIINKNEHDYIIKALKFNNIRKKDYNICYVEPEYVQHEIQNCTHGIFFPVKGFYLNGYFPTKFGEFMAQGIPIITTNINADVNSIINTNKVGYIIKNESKIDWFAIKNFIKKSHNNSEIFYKCIETADSFFNISNAISSYEKIYRKKNI